MSAFPDECPATFHGLTCHLLQGHEENHAHYTEDGFTMWPDEFSEES